MTRMYRPKRSSDRPGRVWRELNPPSWSRPTRISLTVAAAIATVVSFVLFFVLTYPERWNSLGVFSLAISLIGVAVTLLVYERQHFRTVVTEAVQEKQMDDLLESINQVTKAIAKEPPSDVDDSQEETAEALADTAGAEGEGQAIKIGNREGKYLAVSDIPLNVIADLVIGWRDRDREAGNTRRNEGRWSVDNLIGAWRPAGRGNHPWYLTFRDTAGNYSVWRLFRGGYGKTRPTVDDVTPPD